MLTGSQDNNEVQNVSHKKFHYVDARKLFKQTPTVQDIHTKRYLSQHIYAESLL